MGHTELHLFTQNDAQWLIDRHAELYALEEGYDASFQQLVAQIIAEFLEEHDPACERGWVAILDGKRVGSIFCVKDTKDESGQTAKLRLFLLEPTARGTGLSNLLIETCLKFARETGYRHMRLWTHASHVAACRLYEKYGFSCSHSWTEHTFGQDVVSQIWERAL